jgi:GTPase SAR1 family protein
MKTVIITGIDSVGKTTEISRLPWKNTRKYPNNEEIKEQINNLYKVLANDDKLHDSTVRNIYRQIHDLVIMLKARNYPVWKEKFVLKGDENIREPAVLFEQVQKELQAVLRELQESKKIKKYTIIEGLCSDTQEKIVEVISDLITSS